MRLSTLNREAINFRDKYEKWRTLLPESPPFIIVKLTAENTESAEFFINDSPRSQRSLPKDIGTMCG
jgi:hypothetical protein